MIMATKIELELENKELKVELKKTKKNIKDMANVVEGLDNVAFGVINESNLFKLVKVKFDVWSDEQS